MKKYSILLIALILFSSCTLKGKYSYKIEQKSITYINESRNHPLVTEIWYPTKNVLIEKDSVKDRKDLFKAINTISNASIPVNKFPREFVKWWERAIDIKYVLTNVLYDKKFGSKIDTSRIGGVGFSLGGYTNIALAGGYVDRFDINNEKSRRE